MSEIWGSILRLAFDELKEDVHSRGHCLPFAISLVNFVVESFVLPVRAGDSRSGSAGDLINSTRVAHLVRCLCVRRMLTLWEQHGYYCLVMRNQETREYRGTMRLVEGVDQTWR